VGPITWLVERSDEMNGLDPEATRRTIEHGQRVVAEVFGAPARGFVAPAWHTGHVSPTSALGLEYVVGYFSIRSAAGRTVPLTTWTWDCGRWGWLGHVGHGIGQILQSRNRGVPMLAIHPRDLERGYWPAILRLTRELLAAGYEPSTISDLLRATDVEVAA
jgi:hypothetical protein